MPILNKFLSAIDNLNDFAGKCCSWLVLVIIGLYFWEVVLRSIFNSPTTWAHESSTYFFAVFFALGGAYALRHGMMVNVDILVNRLSPRTRAILVVATSLITFVYLWALIGEGGRLAIVSVMRAEHSQTVWGPIVYPLKITVVVGASLVALQALAIFIRNLRTAITGKVQDVTIASAGEVQE